MSLFDKILQVILCGIFSGVLFIFVIAIPIIIYYISTYWPIVISWIIVTAVIYKLSNYIFKS